MLPANANRPRNPRSRRKFGKDFNGVGIEVVSDTATPLHLPDVSGMSNRQAALAYAKAGWYVMPLTPGTKVPSRSIGNSWDRKSSRSPRQIRKWWRENPDHGIGLHVGRSGAVAFDFDTDDLGIIAQDGRPDMAKALRTARGINGTRPDGERSHYLFACEPGEFGNGAGAFARYGQVRGKNGYVVVAPTAHPDADTKGGQYRQVRTGVLKPLPKVLRDCLSEAAEQADSKTPAELEEFLAEYVGDDRPNALKGQLSKFMSEFDAGASRHDSIQSELCWAFREAIAGCYPAQRAYDELKASFYAAKPKRSSKEFDSMAQWAAAQAEQADPGETLARLDRNMWPGPHVPQLVADRVVEQAAKNNHPLVFWREQWLTWTGSYWEITDNSVLRNLLYELLRGAIFEGKNDSERLSWNPDRSKVDKVVDALKSSALLSNKIDPPIWTNGHNAQVIACQNGLLDIDDRDLLPHSQKFFNLFALPFDYDPEATCPRWLKFLREVFPGDREAAELLQEWFGYVLSGRTDLHKMLMIIGPPRSGKGTIDRILERLIGAAHTGLSAGDLKSNFGLQSMLGKSLAVFSDERITVDGKKFVDTLLKITGGDAIRIDVKYHEPWVGRLPTRLMFMSNETPGLPDSSGAIVSRMLVLYMSKSWLGKEDPHLAKALAAELAGILNWSLDGLARLHERGHFVQPASGQQTIELLDESASPVSQFVGELCNLRPGASVLKDDLYDAWKVWCSANGHEVGSKVYLSRKLIAAYPNRITFAKLGGRGKQRPHYVGIALRPIAKPRAHVR